MNITAVVASNRNLELTQEFYRTFREECPDVPLVLSCLDAPQEMLDWLGTVSYDERLQAVRGKRVDGKPVSFSELYNAGINAVSTNFLVLLHTDMFVTEEFFKILENRLENNSFVQYTTVEPPVFVGHRRPGKVLNNFGESFADFKKVIFKQHLLEEVYTTEDRMTPARGGFYLAGSKEAFEDVGGFDQITFDPVYCEDDDLALRILLKGYTIPVSDHARCYHFASLTTGRSTRNRSLESEANLKFFRKWGLEVSFLATALDNNTGGFRINDWKFDELEIQETSDTLDPIELRDVKESLALVQKPLQLGTHRFPGFTVTVKKPVAGSKKQDRRNYLLLQRQTQYSNE